jgi:hypothetical protein
LRPLAIFIFVIVILNVNAVAWRQVTSFAGSGTEQKNTDNFHVLGTEWRVVWSYTPDEQLPALTVFNVIVYPEGETQSYVEFITQTGANQTTGTTYIHQGAGDYYIKAIVANTQGYTVTVEYDEDSVPRSGNISVESAMLVTSIIVAVAVVAAGAMVYVKRRRRRKVRVSSGVHRGKRQSG